MHHILAVLILTQTCFFLRVQILRNTDNLVQPSKPMYFSKPGRQWLHLRQLPDNSYYFEHDNKDREKWSLINVNGNPFIPQYQNIYIPF